ncbi:hypothetical protein BKA67DRAFT_650097 [Truncatella angustata]|uniref:Secreted protein n=1 Tax=Truncatella angustata TaxID=152316 RepID=A0A9P8RPC7_9PEZI|nr:uncharacterized protein BKA67DRAFT_650097 [Truncatella angustata]KAH6646885.1 hypothetical protein BKA67DRAFT_650097 [Truncatella angustata]
MSEAAQLVFFLLIPAVWDTFGSFRKAVGRFQQMSHPQAGNLNPTPDSAPQRMRRGAMQCNKTFFFPVSWRYRKYAVGYRETPYQDPNSRLKLRYEEIRMSPKSQLTLVT